MLGFYDYTVWLTYLSLLSAVAGICISLHAAGHPYLGVFFLMLSGLCDAFDGRVARTKKDRSPAEKAFGIQIDSLADLVAFGVLPACIGEAISTVGPQIYGISRFSFFGLGGDRAVSILILFILMFYVLAALIRLAYFNVMEEERQKTEGGCRKTYIGLPVTSAALIFPSIMLLQYILPFDITPIYYLALLVTGFLFVSKIRVKKPGVCGVWIMVGIGAVEALILLLALLLVRHIH